MYYLATIFKLQLFIKDIVTLNYYSAKQEGRK